MSASRVTAAKTQAQLVTAVSGWVIFAVLTGDAHITRAEGGILLSTLTAAFVTWLVRNEPVDPPVRIRRESSGN